MTRFPISPLHGEKNRSESFATHAGDGECRDVRRKDPGNPEESQGNPPYIVGWEKCKAKAALYARENGLRDVRHAHGELEFSPGVYERKSDAGSVPLPRLGQHLRLILGPPGTGKTTRLLGLLGDVLQGGTGPEQVAFVSFTRAARAEARARVLEQLAVGEDALPWFRTIHSAAYRLLGLRREQVMGPSGWRDFAQRYRYRLTPAARVGDDDDPFSVPARTEDDKLRYVLE